MRTALLASFWTLLCSLPALAEGPVDPQATLDQNLVVPLSRRDASRSAFSRSWQPPQERRARITSTAPQRDGRGQAFVSFVLDVRPIGGAWRSAAMAGCLYPEDQAIFVKVGETYRPAALILGKKATEAPPEACLPAQVAAQR